MADVIKEDFNSESKVQQIGRAISRKAEEGIQSVGEKIDNLAKSVRDKAPVDGAIGSAVNAVADTLDTSGKYLKENKLAEMGHGITSLVKTYPMSSLLAGLGMGFLVGKALTRK